MASVEQHTSGRASIQDERQALPPTLIGYAAGFFDGEGYVGISRRDGSLNVTIGQLDRTPLDKLRSAFEGQVGIYDRGERRPMATWGVSSRMGYRFLVCVAPHLVVKREQALVGLSWQLYSSAARRSTEASSQHRALCIATMDRLKKASDPLDRAAIYTDWKNRWDEPRLGIRRGELVVIHQMQSP